MKGVSFNPKKNKFEVKGLGLTQDEINKAIEEVKLRNIKRIQEAKQKFKKTPEFTKADEQTAQNLENISKATGLTERAVATQINMQNSEALKLAEVRREKETIQRNKIYNQTSNIQNAKLEELKRQEKEIMTQQKKQQIENLRSEAQRLRSEGANVQIVEKKGYGTKPRTYFETTISVPSNKGLIIENKKIEVAERGNLLGIKPSPTGRVGTFKKQEQNTGLFDTIRKTPEKTIRTIEAEMVKRNIENKNVNSVLEFGGGMISGASFSFFEFEGDKKIRSNLSGTKREVFEDPNVSAGKLFGGLTELVYAPFSKATSRTSDFVINRVKYSKIGNTILSSKPVLQVESLLGGVNKLASEKVINPIFQSETVKKIGASRPGKIFSSAFEGLSSVVTGTGARSLREDLGLKKTPKYVIKVTPSSKKPVGYEKFTQAEKESFKVKEKVKTELFEIKKGKFENTNIEGFLTSKSKGEVLATNKEGAKLIRGQTESKFYQEQILSPKIEIFGKTILNPIKSSPQFVSKTDDTFLAITKNIDEERTASIIKNSGGDLFGVLSSKKEIGTSGKGEEIIKSVNRFTGKTGFGKTDTLTRIVEKKPNEILTINVNKLKSENIFNTLSEKGGVIDSFIPKNKASIIQNSQKTGLTQISKEKEIFSIPTLRSVPNIPKNTAPITQKTSSVLGNVLRLSQTSKILNIPKQEVKKQKLEVFNIPKQEVKKQKLGVFNIPTSKGEIKSIEKPQGNKYFKNLTPLYPTPAKPNKQEKSNFKLGVKSKGESNISNNLISNISNIENVVSQIQSTEKKQIVKQKNKQKNKQIQSTSNIQTKRNLQISKEKEIFKVEKINTRIPTFSNVTGLENIFVFENAPTNTQKLTNRINKPNLKFGNTKGFVGVKKRPPSSISTTQYTPSLFGVERNKKKKRQKLFTGFEIRGL